MTVYATWNSQIYTTSIFVFKLNREKHNFVPQKNKLNAKMQQMGTKMGI